MHWEATAGRCKHFPHLCALKPKDLPTVPGAPRPVVCRFADWVRIPFAMCPFIAGALVVGAHGTGGAITASSLPEAESDELITKTAILQRSPASTSFSKRFGSRRRSIFSTWSFISIGCARRPTISAFAVIGRRSVRR